MFDVDVWCWCLGVKVFDVLYFHILVFCILRFLSSAWCRVQGLGCTIQGVEFGVYGLGCRVQNFGVKGGACMSE